MNTQKSILKIVYCLAGILFLASVGFNIFQFQRSKALSAKLNIESNTAYKPSAPKDKNIDIRTQLDIAKKELRKKKQRLTMELSQKEEYLEARYSASSDTSYYSSPARRERLKKTLLENIEEDYAPLSKKMDINKKDFESLKDLLVEKDMELQELMENTPHYGRSAEDRNNIRAREKEIQDKCKENIKSFLNDKFYKIYESYKERLSERITLQNFFKTETPDQKLTEAQIEELIDLMYTGRTAVFDKKDDDDGKLTEAKIKESMERQSLVYRKYLEAAESVMTPELAEKYKAYLKQQLEMNESIMRMSLYLDDI